MNNHQFDLVRSTYPAADAQEVLLSLINDKIKFLNCKIFSLQERFGEAPVHLRERAEELKSKKREVAETLNACGEDCMIEIDCQIAFSIKEGKTQEAQYDAV